MYFHATPGTLTSYSSALYATFADISLITMCMAELRHDCNWNIILASFVPFHTHFLYRTARNYFNNQKTQAWLEVITKFKSPAVFVIFCITQLVSHCFTFLVEQHQDLLVRRLKRPALHKFVSYNSNLLPS